jgi:hypothetical protein
MSIHRTDNPKQPVELAMTSYHGSVTKSCDCCGMFYPRRDLVSVKNHPVFKLICEPCSIVYLPKGRLATRIKTQAKTN